MTNLHQKVPTSFANFAASFSAILSANGFFFFLWKGLESESAKIPQKPINIETVLMTT